MPQFTNRFLTLPQDPNTENWCRQVKESMYSKVQPTPTAQPKILLYSKEVSEALGLDEALLHSNEGGKIFSGNAFLEGMESYAHCYGGHQFGRWAGQLGDGRVIALGEICHQERYWELQLKGAGPTPYSRMGDGRAVLRSSIREFLCSEAMHYLGISTTRALSLTLTGDLVNRDMLYDGRPKDEPGAIVCRVSESFARFGSLEIFSSRGDIANLERMAHFVIQNYYPQFSTDKKGVIDFFHEVCRRTAKLMAQWMSVGFVHGVMNTDNMSLLGVTMDYGPYGWLDIYKEDWTPNTTDAGQLRYAYGNQPHIGGWNCMKLAEALFPLIEEVEALQEGLDMYQEHFRETYSEIRKQKLGYQGAITEIKADSMNRLYELMTETETDVTILFRILGAVSSDISQLEQSDMALSNLIQSAFYQYDSWNQEMHENWAQWLRQHIHILHKDALDDEVRKSQMNAVNPKYIIRNYLAQMAIEEAEKGSYNLLNELYEMIQHPFDEQPQFEKFAEKMPDWARKKVGCSMLSCSS